MSEERVEIGTVLEKIAMQMKDHQDTRPTSGQGAASTREPRAKEAPATRMEIEYSLARPA